MVEVGQKVRFDPFKEVTGFASIDNRGKIVTGTVVFVNHSNRWFLVEYESGGNKLRTSFMFSQLGEDVTICG